MNGLTRTIGGAPFGPLVLGLLLALTACGGGGSGPSSDIPPTFVAPPSVSEPETPEATEPETTEPETPEAEAPPAPSISEPPPPPPPPPETGKAEFERMLAAIGPNAVLPDVSGLTVGRSRAGLDYEQLGGHTSHRSRRDNEGWVRIAYDDRNIYDERVGLISGNTPANERRLPEAGTDYLTFGYWMQVAPGLPETLADAFSVVPFADVSIPYHNDVTLRSSGTGTGTYTGSAVGFFARHADGQYTSGRFKANATITMNFDNDTIQGTINNFRAIRGSAPISDWAVSLPSTSLRVNFTGSSTEVNWQGQIGSRYRGNLYPTGVPTGVAGTFDAHFDDGSARGAFGARDQ